MLCSLAWEEKFMRLALLERADKALAVEAELRDLTRPRDLAAMFDEFVEATRRDPHHHTDSYTHDNGYDKIVLFQDNVTRMKMRLHLWHPLLIPNTMRPRQNVHNHRWDFSSVVLAGHVDHLAYQFSLDSEEGEEFFHYRYYARGSKEHYDVEERGKTRLICTETRRFSQGELYSVENDLLHRVDIPDNLTVATLVITHENVGWVTNDLLAEKSIGFDRTTLPSPAMTKQEIIEKVEGLHNHMGI